MHAIRAIVTVATIRQFEYQMQCPPSIHSMMTLCSHFVQYNGALLGGIQDPYQQQALNSDSRVLQLRRKSKH